MQAITFLREVQEELKKVVWPSLNQTIRLTIMVIAVTLIVGFFIGGVDFLLTQLTRTLIK